MHVADGCLVGGDDYRSAIFTSSVLHLYVGGNHPLSHPGVSIISRYSAVFRRCLALPVPNNAKQAALANTLPLLVALLLLGGRLLKAEVCFYALLPTIHVTVKLK